ncbi:hypothetical protein ILYODFUR_005191 [Ilyodon furcidens]|uniref:Uncharacterized protein n=1 Tax=Ilyodon furcidens TaxID=33524 RepID=A0ABV0UP79_9TELE
MSVYLLVLFLALLLHDGKAKLESQGCNSADAERAGEEAVEQINRDKTDGYILALNRLYDLSHTSNQVRVKNCMHAQKIQYSLKRGLNNHGSWYSENILGSQDKESCRRNYT